MQAVVGADVFPFQRHFGPAEAWRSLIRTSYSRSSDISAQRKPGEAWILPCGGLNVGKVAICYRKPSSIVQTCRSAAFPRLAFSAPILVLQLFRHLTLRSATFPTLCAPGYAYQAILPSNTVQRRGQQYGPAAWSGKHNPGNGKGPTLECVGPFPAVV